MDMDSRVVVLEVKNEARGGRLLGGWAKGGSAGCPAVNRSRLQNVADGGIVAMLTMTRRTLECGSIRRQNTFHHVRYCYLVGC